MQNLELHEDIPEEYDDVPPQMGDYGHPGYWDHRYMMFL